MKLKKITAIDEIESIIDNADKLCKDFDPNSNCKEYLTSKLNSKNTTTYIAKNGSLITGIAIIEIIDRMYGNLILHCINEDDEFKLATLVKDICKNNILELIQFRNNFNYRDTFLDLGFREKERARMIHHNIKKYAETIEQKNISFKEIENIENAICGQISYNAHKHRQHIECYDVYSSEKNRIQFAHDLRTNKHGKSIQKASLLMHYERQAVGIIEVVDVLYQNKNIGWIMDVAILPEFQGLGFGQQIIKKSLSEAHKAGYDSVGLGVTLTNRNAYQLYQDLGFEEYEIFVEIIGI